jgi:hypothetical protein
VPTSFEAKLKHPPLKAPWWGVGAAPFDAEMFRSAQERSAIERRHVPTVAPFEGGDNGDDDSSEGGSHTNNGGPFPTLHRPPTEALPPPVAYALNISKEQCADDPCALLVATDEAAESALSLPPLSSKTKEAAVKAAKDAAGMVKLGHNGGQKANERAKAARKEASKLEQLHRAKVAEHLAMRRTAAKRRFEASCKESVDRNLDECLRVLQHCEVDASEPLPRKTLLTVAQASNNAMSAAVTLKKQQKEKREKEEVAAAAAAAASKEKAEEEEKRRAADKSAAPTSAAGSSPTVSASESIELAASFRQSEAAATPTPDQANALSDGKRSQSSKRSSRRSMRK